MKAGFAFPFLVLALVTAPVACDTGGSPSGGQAGVSVFLTDAPLDLAGVHAVNVSLSAILIYPTEAGSEDEGGIELTAGPISFPGDLTLNLLDFQNGQVTFVGSETVPVGAYSRLRLRVVAAELVRDDDGDPATPDVTEPVTIPSGKVDVTAPFELTAGENLAVTIDFDAQASVQVNTTNGKNAYLLRPVINVVGMKAS
jgi:hypothetical protein